MEQNIKTLNPETSSFVEALEAVVKAEEKVLSTFLGYYGDGKNGGEFVFEDTEISSHFEEIRKTLRDFISHQIEEDLYKEITDGKEERV